MDQFFNKYAVKKDTPLLVSFSGGSDSVYLVEQLLKNGYKNISLIYFNHSIRSLSEMSSETNIIKSFANKFQLQLMIRKCPCLLMKQKYNVSIEEAGALLRKKWLKHIAQIKKIQFILTAHHADDQAETILLRLIKGSKITCLPVKESFALADSIYILRPLLDTSKKTILNFLNSNNISFINDSTNNELNYERNRLRHRVIPELMRINQSYSKSLISYFKFLESLSSNYHEVFCNFDLENILIDIKGFQYPKKELVQLNHVQLTIFIQKLMSLYYQSSLVTDSFKQHHINESHIKSICELLQKDKVGALVSLPGCHYAYVSRRFLVFLRSNNCNMNFEYKKIIQSVSTKIFPFNKVVQSNFFDSLQPLEPLNKPFHVNIAVSNKHVSLTLRNILPDDTFVPLGLSVSKNINQYLKDKKCDWYFRKYVLVLCVDDAIAWVVGYSISEDFKILSNQINQTFLEVKVV